MDEGKGKVIEKRSIEIIWLSSHQEHLMLCLRFFNIYNYTVPFYHTSIHLLMILQRHLYPVHIFHHLLVQY